MLGAQGSKRKPVGIFDRPWYRFVYAVMNKYYIYIIWSKLLDINAKSLKHIEYNKGPIIDPCGTPQMVLCREEL